MDGLDEIAATFWHECRLDADAVPYPRDLTAPILLGGLPLDIEDSAGLQLHAALACAERIGFPVPPCSADRTIRACLVAWHGRGLIVLDNTDPTTRRYSLAEAAARFLADYYIPRRHCLAALGDAFGEVLDGVRPATRTERLTVELAGAPLGVYIRFFTEREPDAANAPALQLLAPPGAVWDMCMASPGWLRLHPVARRLRATYMVCETFGLPPAIAAAYAAQILDRYLPDPQHARPQGDEHAATTRRVGRRG